VARDLTFLIDTSGSMSGFPLEQAKKVVLAMIDTLGVNDRLELIEFGSSPRRWKDAPQPATETNKHAASAWVAKLSAGGGTEMHRAVLEALKPLRAGSQRQVVLLTDGLIGFEREIIDTLMKKLPDGVRMHAVGVGSGINRSLTQAVARAARS
jgi:Ca-activated chloride channel homolog